MANLIRILIVACLIISCDKGPIAEPPHPDEKIEHQQDSIENEDDKSDEEPDEVIANYFPSQNTWDSLSIDSLGWNRDSLANLLSYLESKHTYGFIVLHKGRIAVEQYWNDWNANTPYMIASAGKTVTAFLVGTMQEKELLSIEDETSAYLGEGWSSAPPEKESQITIRHHLSMTTGLSEEGDQCMEPSCLSFIAEAGSRWAYHSGAYNLLNLILEKASGSSLSEITKQHLADKIGWQHWSWENHILTMSTRDMAKFGLLMLNDGNWKGETLLGDTTYFNNMIAPSSELNKSYGYLWWLNGQESFMVTGDENVHEGWLVPTAPKDMYAAMGKGDKKIYIVPSLDLVVVRHGHDTGTNTFGPSSFDTELWGKLKGIIGY